VNNEYWESRTDVRRVLHLYSDGTLIFRGAGDPTFLCWPPDQLRRRVNPVVACESALSFARFYQALIPMFVTEPNMLMLRVELHNAMPGGAALGLPPGGIMGASWQMGEPAHLVNGPNPAAAISITRDEICTSPDAVAFAVVSKFYEFFDYKPSEIPYVSARDDKQIIDVALFDSR
jgi:hypothetical protein